MTESELIQLRDNLLGFNTQLTALENRISVLEASALPKNSYFESLKTAFEDSPECCDCTTTTECACATSISEIWLKSDSDDLTYQNAVYKVNGEAVSDLGGIIASEGYPIYVFNTVTEEYIESLYYLKLTNLTSEDLCIEISVSNPLHPLQHLQIPPDGYAVEYVYKTSFNILGTDFVYTVNESLQVVNDTAELAKIKFCLKGN